MIITIGQLIDLLQDGETEIRSNRLMERVDGDPHAGMEYYDKLKLDDRYNLSSADKLILIRAAIKRADS